MISDRWACPSFLVVALALVAGVAAMADFTVDDAHISFRFAENLAHGQGLRWNPQDAPVEGYTNFLWVVVLAAGVKLGLLPDVLAQVISALAALVVIGLFVSARDLIPSLGVRVAVAAVYALSPSTWVHGASGLETLAFGAVILSLATMSVRRATAQDGRGSLVPLVVLMIVAPLLRPEGCLVTTVVALWLVSSARNSALQFRRALAWTAVAAALLVGYWVIRTVYFGHLFPLPFYVKVGRPAAGLRWLLRNLLLVSAPLCVGCAVVVRRGRGRAAVLAALSVVVPLVLLYASSDLYMDYSHRFLHHIWPAMLLVLGVGLSHLIESPPDALRRMPLGGHLKTSHLGTGQNRPG